MDWIWEGAYILKIRKVKHDYNHSKLRGRIGYGKEPAVLKIRKVTI